MYHKKDEIKSKSGTRNQFKKKKQNFVLVLIYFAQKNRFQNKNNDIVQFVHHAQFSVNLFIT